MSTFVEHMIGRIEEDAEMDLAGEFAGFLLVFVEVGERIKEVVPFGGDGAGGVEPLREAEDGDGETAKSFVFIGAETVFNGEDERFVEGVGGDEHQFFVPGGVGGADWGRTSAAELSAELELDEGFGSAGFVGRDEILSFDDVHAKVGEFGGEIDLGTGVGEAVVRDGVGVGVPGFREGFVSLSSDPNGEHELAVVEFLALLVF